MTTQLTIAHSRPLVLPLYIDTSDQLVMKIFLCSQQ